MKSDDLKKSIFLLLVFVSIAWNIFSQSHLNFRITKVIPVEKEIKIDSMSIVPGSLHMLIDENTNLPDSLYSVDYAKAIITFSENVVSHYTELKVSYRVFSFSFGRDYFLRDTSEIFSEGIQRTAPSGRLVGDPLFSSQESKLNSSGSISRGIMIGNQQDVIFNSQLNLQLTGKLTDELNIEATISDNNIPLQPEGYSQKIQEFDKVYISIYNEKLRLTAGDFEIIDQEDYFLKMNRKAQGALFSGSFYSGADSSRLIETSVSGSVAKGRFARNTIRAVEGNQGPYRLTGENNELYIIILAGTERVFIDGKLMSRGLNHDYIIDYNLAEIIFTANQPINRNRRIVVEFEYSDRNYPRFMAYTKNRITTKNASVHVGFYSEQDAKNQSLQQLLDQEQRSLLASIGDSLHLAFVPKIDSVEFSNNYVLYRKTDTIINSTEFMDVYVYSSDPDLAHFRLNFTYLGENKGNYISDVSSANGRVYKWVAPVGGVPQGTHEPVIFLVTPKKMQVLNVGAEIKPGRNSRAGFEMAFSNHDLNTFSSLDRSDNNGFAIRAGVGRIFSSSDTSRFQMDTSFEYELIGKDFSTTERYRPIEFERDWNVRLAELQGNQNMVSGKVNIQSGQSGYTAWFIDYFNSEGFNGFRNSVQSDNRFAGFRSSLLASYLTTKGAMNQETAFLRHRFDISRPVGTVVVGFISEAESNSWELSGNDSLLINSFKNNDLVFYLNNAEEAVNKWRIEGRQRKDYLPLKGAFELFSLAKELSGSMGLVKNSNHILNTRLNYRMVNYGKFQDSLANENSFSGRLEYFGRFFNGAISSNTYLETLTGREQKKDFFYLEVTAGQGVYKWVDYNSNGLKELDEFEIAGFPDEADHIRVLLPTNLWVKTQINQLGQTLNITPAASWRNETGFRKFASRFTNQFSFRTVQKIENGEPMDFLKILQISMLDSQLVNLNANLRNTFSFNRSNPRYGADYILQRNWSKVLLVNGADQRELLQQIVRLRWSPINSLMITPLFEKGSKENISEFFPARNYSIDIRAYEAAVQYQLDLKIQLKLNYKFSSKKNLLSVERNESHEIKLESMYTIPANFQLNAQLRYIKASYNAPVNTSIAYEMLEGLNAGKNLNWNLLIQKSLPNNLEITVNYSGRVSEGRDIIHTGGVQARAYF
jgi:hypothetical protein